MKSILIAPRRYVQGRHVLREIGGYVKALGKKALVLWSPRIKGLLGPTVLPSLKEAGVGAVDVEFRGETTRAEAARVADAAKDAACEVIIGAGLYREEQEAYDHVARPGRVYEPDPKLTARYAEWYQTLQQLYPALKGVHARLRAQA